jgi:hypothetical protein
MQIAHSSLEKYFFPPPLLDLFFFLCWESCLELLGRADSLGSPGIESWTAGGAGGVRMSEGEIGGGGGTSGPEAASAGGIAGEVLTFVTDVVGDVRERRDETEAASDSSSFSQMMSGVQTRSGRESTTRAGARSASRCLPHPSAPPSRFEAKSD